MDKKKKQNAFQKVAALTIYPYAAKAIKKKMGGRSMPTLGTGGATAKAARKKAKKKSSGGSGR